MVSKSDIITQTKQSKGLKRNTIDKYYTKYTIVDLCIGIINKYIVISPENDIIIEPSSGNGSFIKNIKSLCNNTFSMI